MKWKFYSKDIGLTVNLTAECYQGLDGTKTSEWKLHTLHPSSLYSCFILHPLCKLASFAGANMFLSKGFWPHIFPPCALHTQLLVNSEFHLVSPSSPTISTFLEMMLWLACLGSCAHPCSHQAAELGIGCLLQYSHYVILLMVLTWQWTSLCLGLASEEWARSLKQFTSYSLPLHHISQSSYFFGGAQSLLAKWKSNRDWMKTSPSSWISETLLQPIEPLLPASPYYSDHLPWLWDCRLSLIVSKRGAKFPWKEF